MQDYKDENLNAPALDKLQPVKEPHISIDIKHNDTPQSEPPPPPFAPYEPEFFVKSDGEVISHDHHLNEDGEALYRFLLAQSAILPTYILNIHGTHNERRTRVVSRTENGKTTQRTETYTVTVTDFNFQIDLSSYIVHGPIFWSYPDETAAYRGLMVRQVNTPTRRKATKDEITAFKSEDYFRVNGGLAPWQYSDGSYSSNHQASSKTPRAWADEYAASPKLLKEFVYRKVIYGWNTSKLTEAISSAIAQTSYTGHVQSTFKLSNAKISIRPDNRLSRTLSSTLYKVLLIITLIYPFILLFKRFNRHGGGRWEVVGAAYGLKHFEQLESPPKESNDQLKGNDNVNAEGRHPCHIPRVVETEHGMQKLIGYREGEWFKEWEPVIKRCAAMRLTSNEPLKSVKEARADPMGALEGYGTSNLEGY
ncbi:hypothetical protein JR316_0001024 [Psilocybe cubensis]|uniref:Uncharacterized protein n=2 Tax=Psilocybe cubensis TaxID=181762 RepID=A0ACB8HGL8_PSICU|nr:hypothetical protein JR316_0001024 [Psilocybe cubensis]KAH9486958.1 hypothetical protein JR316_0001024 [Psilocybe cubensis]